MPFITEVKSTPIIIQSNHTLLTPNNRSSSYLLISFPLSAMIRPFSPHRLGSLPRLCHGCYRPVVCSALPLSSSAASLDPICSVCTSPSPNRWIETLGVVVLVIIAPFKRGGINTAGGGKERHCTASLTAALISCMAVLLVLMTEAISSLPL